MSSSLAKSIQSSLLSGLARLFRGHLETVRHERRTVREESENLYRDTEVLYYIVLYMCEYVYIYMIIFIYMSIYIYGHTHPRAEPPPAALNSLQLSTSSASPHRLHHPIDIENKKNNEFGDLPPPNPKVDLLFWGRWFGCFGFLASPPNPK
jgi:sterol desaturase/sphingolipid hydroxylase (fatty acid hydroxylase superfamily)